MIDTTTITPAMKPMMMALPTEITSALAVIPTKPAEYHLIPSTNLVSST